jgi:hypothetical protein
MRFTRSRKTSFEKSRFIELQTMQQDTTLSVM